MIKRKGNELQLIVRKGNTLKKVLYKNKDNVFEEVANFENKKYKFITDGGTNYFNLGYRLGENGETFWIEISLVDNTNFQALFGSRDTLGGVESYGSFVIRFDYGGTGVNVVKPSPLKIKSRYSFNNNKWYVNNVLKSESLRELTSTERETYILNFNTGGYPVEYVNLLKPYTEIYDWGIINSDGTNRNHFTPQPDLTYKCLITGEVLTKLGSGILTCEEINEYVDDWYKDFAEAAIYIEFDGTQLIKTGYYIQPEDIFSCKIQHNVSLTNTWFYYGCRTQFDAPDSFYGFQESGNPRIMGFYSGTDSRINAPLMTSGDIIYDIKHGNRQLYVDNISAGEFDQTPTLSPYEFTIGGIITHANRFQGRIWGDCLIEGKILWRPIKFTKDYEGFKTGDYGMVDMTNKTVLQVEGVLRGMIEDELVGTIESLGISVYNVEQAIEVTNRMGV